MFNEPKQSGFPGVEHEVEWIQAEQFDPKAWIEAVEQRQSMGTHVPRHGVPQLPSEKLKGVQFAGPSMQEVVVQKTKNPDPGASFSFVGLAVSVESKQALIEGHVFIPIERAEESGIAADSVRVFRWLSEAKEFQLVMRSGSSKGWAWAQICIPGVYVAVGLPRDPIASRLLKIGWTLSDITATSEGKFYGGLLTEIGTTLYKNLDGMIPDDDEIPPGKSPLGGGGGGGGPARRVDPQTVLDVIGSRPRPPEYQILADLSTFHSVWDRWEFVGPQNIAGMSRSVVIDPVEPDRIYTCSSDGGVWRLDGVLSHPDSSWEPITDDLPLQRTRALAVAPSDNRVLYVQIEDGRLYRSSNRGSTWEMVNVIGAGIGLAERILVDPLSENRVYLATTTGLWRSDDGGRTWATGGALIQGDVTDMAIDPANADIIYFAVRGVGLFRSVYRGILTLG